MPGQFHFGEVALPDGFEQAVVSNVGRLRLIGAAGPNAGPAGACAELGPAVAVRGVLQRGHAVRPETVSSCDS